MESFSYTFHMSPGTITLEATLDSEHHNVKVMFSKSFVERTLDKQWRKLAKSVKHRGFRAGKVPRQMVEQMVKDKDQMYNSIFCGLADDQLMGCAPHKVMLITAHHGTKQDDGGWMVELMAFLEPDVTITKSPIDVITAALPPLPTIDQYVDNRVMAFAKMNPYLHLKVDERGDTLPVGDGDMAEVQIEAMVNGARYPDACEEATRIRMMRGAIPNGLYDDLLGKKPGDFFKLESSDTAQFKELVGKTMQLEVKVLRVYTCEEPKIDDDLGISANFHSLAEFKAALAGGARRHIAQTDVNNRRGAIIKHVLDNITVGPLSDMWLDAKTQHVAAASRMNVQDPIAFRNEVKTAMIQYLAFKTVGESLGVEWDDKYKTPYARDDGKYCEKVLQYLLSKAEFVYVDSKSVQDDGGDQNRAIQG